MQLALFFTRGVSLKLWLDTGLFDHEKQLYEEHLRRKHFKKVYWLTYGTEDAEIASELKAADRLHPDIMVLPMAHFLPGRWNCLLYSFLMPLFHRRCLKSADILKTNQMDGSWAAVLAKWLYHRPLVARTGYTWSLLRKMHNAPKHKQRLVKTAEYLAYKNASVVMVTTRTQANYVLKHYPLSNGTVHVVPNYVDTQLFKPQKSVEKYSDRLVFVGRLNEEKNLFNLIEAITQTDLTLDIYGKGNIRNELETRVKKLKARVNFMGVVPNNELPAVLNRYRYYILPSLREGMPKSLLEALACGLVCIGTNVGGINEIIEDGVNGYLAKTTQPEALAEAINKATQLPHDSITTEGIRRIRNNFSLKTVVEQEKEIITKLKI